MAGKRKVLPLDAEAYKRLFEAVKADDDVPVDVELAIYLMMFCGLRVGEAVHVHKSWFSESVLSDGTVVLDLEIPDYYPCFKDDGCSLCSRDSTRHDDPGVWGPKTTGRQMKKIQKPKPVPVPSEFTNHSDYSDGESKVETGLPELVDRFFTLHDYVGGSTNKVRRHLHRIATDEGLQYVQGRGVKELSTGTVADVHPHDLRGSWAVQALRSEVSDRKLMDWAGWQSIDEIRTYGEFVDDPDGKQRRRF